MPATVGSSVVLLVDGPDPALDRLVAGLEGPGGAGLGTLGSEIGSSVVTLVRYGAAGTLLEIGVFDLGGVGQDDLSRRLSARRQLTCLAEAVDQLAQPSEQPDLLRSLGPAADLALLHGTGEPPAVVAFGFARSGGDGFVVADTDLETAESRAFVLDELERVGLVPDWVDRPVNLVLMAPDQGISSGIQAAAVRQFADDLCDRVDQQRCAVVGVLR
jgi:hypothetical protein